MFKRFKDAFKIATGLVTIGYGIGIGFHLSGYFSKKADEIDAYQRGIVDGMDICKMIVEETILNEKNKEGKDA
jgi:hypothetical protein